MKKHFALMLMAALALGMGACKEKAKSETTEKSVIGGTEVETTTTTETTVDDDGDTTRETHTKTTVDPEGMLNKTTTEETTTEESHSPE